MAVLKSLLLLRRACSSSSLLTSGGAIGSLPSSFPSSRFLPFSPAAHRKPEISFPEDLPSDYTKVDGGEECMSLTRKTKDGIYVKTHVMQHDAQQDYLSVSNDSNVRDAASFNWIGDFDDVFVVDNDKIVYLGKIKLEGEGEGGGGGGDDHGDGDGDGDDLSVSDDSNVHDASSNEIGDIDDEYIVVDDKIVFLGKFKVKRKLENIGEGEGEGGGGDQGESGGGGGDHRRSIWMRLKDFF